MLVGIMALVVATACKPSEVATDPTVEAFVERHGMHLRDVATGLAGSCPEVFAELDESGVEARPRVNAAPLPPIPDGSLLKDEAVRQVAVLCVRASDELGRLVTSLHDPFAEGRAALPPFACDSQTLKGTDPDRLSACVDRTRTNTAAVTLRRPIEGGHLEVFVLLDLDRQSD